MKTKPGSHSNTSASNKPSLSSKAKKKKIYTAKELNLPALNMISPVTAPENPTNLAQRGGAGKKKNKIYIDDVEGMKTILAMVTAEKEGMIESKIARARQLEEVREARRAEMEKRKESRKEVVEGVKRGLKKGRKGKEKPEAGEDREGLVEGMKKEGRVKKKVSFA